MDFKAERLGIALKKIGGALALYYAHLRRRINPYRPVKGVEKRAAAQWDGWAAAEEKEKDTKRSLTIQA